MKEELLIGLDFGSDSVRAIVLDITGKPVAESVRDYPRWSGGRWIEPDRAFFRQHPLDYLESMTAVLQEVLAQVDPSLVRGIGVDCTGATPCAADASGRPLALLPEFAEEPDAMFLLWKDHSAIAEAREIARAAKVAPVDYTRYCGGDYSPEWYWAKFLYVLRHHPKLRIACRSFVEHCDWIPAVLTGKTVVPSRCAAGHKALWHASWGGLPPEEFFSGIDPLLAGRREVRYAQTATGDRPAGILSPLWAAKLGLRPDTVIAGGVFDCHAGAVGSGVGPGILVKVFGTSTCDVTVAPAGIPPIPGICGQVDGSVLPGMTGLEAGQAAFGDIFAWFRRFLSYAGPVSLEQLEKEALAVEPGKVFALDWMNGRRTPEMNPALTGAIFGLTLGTDAPSVYRALVESAAFGARRIVEHFRKAGIAINSIRGTGGIAFKSPLVMQTCADVLNMPIQVVDSGQTCASGSAMLAAAASHCFPDLAAAMRAMAPGIRRTYLPDAERAAVYERLFLRYLAFAGATEKELMR